MRWGTPDGLLVQFRTLTVLAAWDVARLQAVSLQ
jgi:hypothetical protein